VTNTSFLHFRTQRSHNTRGIKTEPTSSKTTAADGTQVKLLDKTARRLNSTSCVHHWSSAFVEATVRKLVPFHCRNMLASPNWWRVPFPQLLKYYRAPVQFQFCQSAIVKQKLASHSWLVDHFVVDLHSQLLVWSKLTETVTKLKHQKPNNSYDQIKLDSKLSKRMNQSNLLVAALNPLSPVP